MKVWAVLSDEQMSNSCQFSLLNDEQMSNWLGVEHQPEVNGSYTVPKNPGACQWVGCESVYCFGILKMDRIQGAVEYPGSGSWAAYLLGGSSQVPVSKWLGTPIYEPSKGHLEGEHPYLIMVMNHLLYES